MPVGALRHFDSTGEFVWFVGVDSDHYTNLELAEMIGDEDLHDRLRQRILTSVVKHLDVGAIAVLEQYSASGTVDDFVLTIENGGVDYSTSGGHVDPHVELMEAAKQAIISGEVVLTIESQDEIVFLRDLLEIGS